MGRLIKLLGAIFGIFWLFIIAVAAYWLWHDGAMSEKWLATGVPAIGRFVMANRTIAKGEVIQAKDVVEIPAWPAGIPDDALLCKDMIIGKTTSDEIRKAYVVTAGALVDGKKEFDAQMDKFHQNGDNPNVLCSHKYGSFWDDDSRQSMYWLVTPEDGVPEGTLYKIEDVEANFETEHIGTLRPVQNCWQFVGRVSKYGHTQGQAVDWLDLVLPEGFKTKQLVTTKDIEAGAPVNIKELKKEEVDCANLPVDAISDEQLIDDCVVAHVKIPKGSIVRAPDLDVSKEALAQREKERKAQEQAEKEAEKDGAENAKEEDEKGQ